jgi:pimeloyl-ACP methyl ester carboxylesterase
MKLKTLCFLVLALQPITQILAQRITLNENNSPLIEVINRINIPYPERIETLIVQNGCCYKEGLEAFWDPIKALWEDRNNKEAIKQCQAFHSPEGLKWQYTDGVADPSVVSPDNWEIDLRHLLRPENDDIQIAMFYDYRNNVKQYPKWQTYLREQNPEMLIVYGKNDYIFPVAGAEAFKKDVRNLEFHLYDTGHFALESFGPEIATTIRNFLERKVGNSPIKNEPALKGSLKGR